MIKESIDFEDFLKKMVSLDYEIKQGKHIAFKHSITLYKRNIKSII